LSYFKKCAMKIRSHKELEVYCLAFDTAMKIFVITKKFPKEEMYSLTDQIRRSSRSVCSNLAEAFRKRRYPKAFISKLSDSESESAESQTWLDFSLSCGYITDIEHSALNELYDRILGKLVNMSLHPENWSW
jgi:four helix bundle protein